MHDRDKKIEAFELSSFMNTEFFLNEVFLNTELESLLFI